MMKLGFSGFLMVISEFLAFEILTLASSYLSNTILAAQAALASLSFVTFQIPFSFSIAGSTRLANLIGAGLPGASKICIQVTLMMALAAGLLNMTLLTTLRDFIPKLFTEDMEVRAAIFAVLPIFASFQLFDAGVANVNGIMRGMGRQGLGSWVNMCCYYLVCVSSFTPDFFPPAEKKARSQYQYRLASLSDSNGVYLDYGWVHPQDYSCRIFSFLFPFPTIHSVHTPPLCFHIALRLSLLCWQLQLTRALQRNYHRRLAHIQHELGPHHRSRIPTKRVCLTSILRDRQDQKLVGFHRACSIEI
jgi:hypothetical protein